MNNKVETYIGFAIKKGSVVFGCDNIEKYRKKIRLVLYTGNLSDNSLSVLKAVSGEKKCPLIKIENYDVLVKRNCKALAITDVSLANAIIENLMLVAGR